MEMSGQQKIEATSKKTGHCLPRTAGKMRRVIAWRQIERVMRYHDSFDAIGKPAEMLFHAEHLPVIDTAALDDDSPGRIAAGNAYAYAIQNSGGGRELQPDRGFVRSKLSSSAVRISVATLSSPTRNRATLDETPKVMKNGRPGMPCMGIPS